MLGHRDWNFVRAKLLRDGNKSNVKLDVKVYVISLSPEFNNPSIIPWVKIHTMNVITSPLKMTKYKAKLSETDVMKKKTTKRGQIVSVVFL